MACVTSASMQVLWNGEMSDSFLQGDPLSPYLFVLGMERLGHLIDRATEEKRWEPIRLSRKGPGISHLFFADDLLLFCKPSESGANTLKETLDVFCHFAGHKVQKSKTQVFFSSNVKDDMAQSICEKLGFTRVSFLGIYLGMPLIHGRLGVNSFQFLVDKGRNKLSSWDVQKLSLAGRFTLIKSVLLSIQNYFMATTKIPVTICNEIEKMARMFL